jgi:hypothetical protein
MEKIDTPVTVRAVVASDVEHVVVKEGTPDEFKFDRVDIVIFGVGPMGIPLATSMRVDKDWRIASGAQGSIPLGEILVTEKGQLQVRGYLTAKPDWFAGSGKTGA